jgi:hypothetical protein
LYATNCGNGSVLYSYPLPATSTYGAAPLSSGDGGAGTSHIILVDYNSDVVYYMTTAGSVANSHPISAKLYDIAYDWRNRLIWGSDSNCTVYGFDTSGSIVASFPGPESYGITYYGQYLWAGESAGYIYQFHCPDDISVEPASMGKIKAAYR